MTTREINSDLHFDIHASIVFQLGDSLITDVVQALTELIKNAYDADSTYANIIVETRNKLRDDPVYAERVSKLIRNPPYSDAQGYIIIEDGGVGMDLETIKGGWLLISNLLKRDLKRRKATTQRGRTPLGDKGLGRLGVQRLGYNVEILTKTAVSNVGYYVAFSWNDFLNVKGLAEVPVRVDPIEGSWLRQGTTLIISELKDMDRWRGTSAISRLESELSQIISPYKEVRDFFVTGVVNGQRLNFAEISDKIRDAAVLRYYVNFDEEVLHIKGKARVDFFRPLDRQDLLLFEEIVEKDNGTKFFAFLADQKMGRSFGIKRSQEVKWFIEYEIERSFSSLNKLSLINGKPANPGPFHAEVDFFNLRNTEQQDVFNRLSEYRKYIKALSGIRVYRDGFGIRVDEDWLGLAKLATAGLSYYGLRAENTLGYVALTARDNAQLEETTDREGFKITPYYENFYELLQLFVRFTSQSQEFVRRGWNEFKSRHQMNVARLEPGMTPEMLSRKIVTSLSEAERTLSAAKVNLEKMVDQTQEAIGTVAHIIPQNTVQSWYTQESTKAIQKTIEQTRDTVIQVEKNISAFSNLEAEAEVLRNQIETLREQLSQAYEVVSLGLTAEALSHEINTIASQIAERNRRIINYLREKNIRDQRLLSFTEYINTSVSALRKQLAHLSPSLKYVREKKEDVVLIDFFREIEEYHQERLAGSNIFFEIRNPLSDNFIIFMNKGKLTQIIDNILLNSEYWLKEDLRLKYVTKGVITIEIAKPFVRISDNGRGIDRSVEGILFEPFVTAKGRGVGRGLGLFIVQQLLDSESCSIQLLPIRNQQYNRLYVFEIDFRGSLKEHD